MYRPVLAITTVAAAASLTACASRPQFPDASPQAVTECRQEAALLTETVRGDPVRSQEGADEVIETARTAREEAAEGGLASWPEDVLIYRCLVSRGEPVTAEQARELAKWQERLERPESR